MAYNYVQRTPLSSSSDCGIYGMSFKQVKEEIRSWWLSSGSTCSASQHRSLRKEVTICCITIYYAYTCQRMVINGYSDIHAGGVLWRSSPPNRIAKTKLCSVKKCRRRDVGQNLSHAINLVRFINAIESDLFCVYLTKSTFAFLRRHHTQLFWCGATTATHTASARFWRSKKI